MLKSTSMAIVALVGCTLFSVAAIAHPKLVNSTPPADAVIDSSPKELRLSFNEELVAKFCGAELKNQQGQTVELGSGAADPADKKQLVVPLPTPLAAGVYKVDWHAVAADTHRIHGSYSFTVKR